VLPSSFGHRYHSHLPIISLPTIYSSSFLRYLPLLSPDITLSTLLSISPQYTVLHPCVTFPFGPRYHSPLPTISLLTIYSSSPLCYLPHLAPDITLNTLLSVSPQYTFLHPSFTFHSWPQTSLSTPYYQSPHNIHFFIPVLPSNLEPDITLSTLLSVSPQYKVLHPSVPFHFWPQISLSLPYYQSPHNIHFFIPMLPSAFGPDITLITLLSFSPQYTFLHPFVSFPFWPQISLSLPYFKFPHNIQFFIPVLPSAFGNRYHSHHSIIILPKIYNSSPLCYLPLLAPDITLITLLSISPQCKSLLSCVTFPFWPQISLSAPYYQSPHNKQFFTPLLPSPFVPRYHSHYPIISLPSI